MLLAAKLLDLQAKNIDGVTSLVDKAGNVIATVNEATQEWISTAGDVIYWANGDVIAQDWISKNKKGSINSEFPKEWLGKTLDEINKAAQTGDSSAKKAKKLLGDKRFDKNDNRK